MTALGAKIGDVVTVGDRQFELRTLIKEEPDRSLRALTLGPRMIVARRALAGSRLIAPGAQVYWYSRIRLRDGIDAESWITGFERDAPHAGYRIVNAAGLGSRRLADGYGGGAFDINPRRGQFLLFDKSARPLVQHILLPVPTAHTKGVLVSPTIFGNLLAGPTAEDLPLDDPAATHTTVDGIRRVLEGGSRLVDGLARQPIIATYAGARCACSQGSYIIRYNDGAPGVVTLTGVRSTGLTTSISLARHLVDGMQKELGLELLPDTDALDSRPESAWPGWWRRPFENGATDARADHGCAVCFCELISEGEIRDALDSPLRPRTMDALKRRTRVLTGRCQGFDCQVSLAEIVSGHTGIGIAQLTKNGPGSELVASGQAEVPA